MCRNVLCSKINHMANFDVLTQRGFSSYSEYSIANQCKLYHDSKIIPSISKSAGEERGKIQKFE